MKIEEEPSESSVVSASEQILDLLEDRDRALTRQDAFSVLSNVSANIIMASANALHEDTPTRAGQMCALLTHLINTHVEEIVRHVHGGAAVERFHDQRFMSTLECASMPAGTLTPSQKTHTKESKES